MINNTNRIMINTLGMPELTCFEDLVRETRLSANLIYWLSKKDEDIADEPGAIEFKKRWLNLIQ